MFNSFAFNTFQYNTYPQTTVIVDEDTTPPGNISVVSNADLIVSISGKDTSTRLWETGGYTSLYNPDLLTRLSDTTATVILTERNT
jgi:hypothetical protein